MTDITIDRSERVVQGDILRDVEYVEHVTEEDGVLEVAKIRFPTVIILSQDCDLQWDFVFRNDDQKTKDKCLISILVAPLYNVEHVYTGEHLERIGIDSRQIKKKRTEGKILRRNQNPRYHYLEFPSSIPLVPSVIDFKHYFTAPVAYLSSIKDSQFVCSVSPIFREQISHRFSSFLSRIGLPEPGKAEPPTETESPAHDPVTA
jgi:hypothetical protein